MNSPITYADWVSLFERFGNGDDLLFEEMNSGYFDLDVGTAQRFYLKTEEAYKKRKQLWLEQFQRSFNTQNIKTADEFGAILQNNKKNLIPLLKFVMSKGLPVDLKNVLHKDMTEFVAEIKKSLLESISKIIRDKEKMLIIINSFNFIENIQKEHLQNTQNKKTVVSVTTVRKIIF